MPFSSSRSASDSSASRLGNRNVGLISFQKPGQKISATVFTTDQMSAPISTQEPTNSRTEKPNPVAKRRVAR
jgi:hypothetical protein